MGDDGEIGDPEPSRQGPKSRTLFCRDGLIDDCSVHHYDMRRIALFPFLRLPKPLDWPDPVVSREIIKFHFIAAEEDSNGLEPCPKRFTCVIGFPKVTFHATHSCVGCLALAIPQMAV